MVDASFTSQPRAVTMTFQFQSPQTYTLAERRASQRRDVDYAATIRIPGAAPIPCRVINVSAGGALLELPDVIGMPPDLYLIVPGALFEASCSVRHQTGRRVGVMFTSSQREALARFG
jgi:hypothetical protein